MSFSSYTNPNKEGRMSKKQYLLIISFSSILFSSYSIKGAESSPNPVPYFLAQLEDVIIEEEFNAYNPAVDYLDFQQSDAEEEKDVNFFKDGRLLSVFAFPAYRFFFPEKAYTPYLNFGAGLNHFVNLNVSIQFSFLLGTHNLFDETGDLGQSTFSNIYTDVKHYWNRDRLIKTLAYFNPFVFIGGVFSQRNTVVYITDIAPVSSSSFGFGMRCGLGMEIHFSKKFFIGVQLSYEFLSFKNKDGTDGNIIKRPSTGTLYLPASSSLGVIFLGANF